jgi:predicted DsbA family dithiol-disulfide isomerase
VRLRRLQDELGDGLVIEWRAFPLRPERDPAAVFKGTYREDAWRRCGAMAAPDGIAFAMWARDDFADWSLPALEAAKCVARQGGKAFERLHLRLYEAFFARGVNIARRDEVLEVVREAVERDFRAALTEDRVHAIPTVIVMGGRRLTGLADLAVYRQALLEA